MTTKDTTVEAVAGAAAPSTEPAAPTPPAPPTMGARWATLIGALAAGFGRTTENLNEQLATQVGEPKDENLELFGYVEDDALAMMADAKAPKARVAKAIADLRKALAPEPEPAPVATPSDGTDFTALLPSLPDDQSFLSALVDIDPLKVDEMVAVAGVRGMLAYDLGLDGIPKRVMQEVESYAVDQGEQCPPIFF